MGGVHGNEAQEAKAKRKKEKRAAKAAALTTTADGQVEHGARRTGMGKALTSLFNGFTRGLNDAVEAEVVTRTRAMKSQAELLRGQVREAKKLAESRKSELDGQVKRAREAETALERVTKDVSELKGKLKACEVSEGALKVALAEATTRKSE
jgi:hypothetical protein